LNTTIHPILDQIPHHLYVCAADSTELRNHIVFRDFLLKDATTRQQYQELKYKIAETAEQDRKRYAILKEINAQSFINNILERASGSGKTEKMD
jgi:GrpB-like predicted nucleotidyltransferase (UPF0157 family)